MPVFEQAKNGVFLPRHQIYLLWFQHSPFHTMANPIHKLWTPVDWLHLNHLKNVFGLLAHVHETSTNTNNKKRKKSGSEIERQSQSINKKVLLTLYSCYYRKYQKTSKYFTFLNMFHKLFNLLMVHTICIAHYDRFFLLLLLSPLLISENFVYSPPRTKRIIMVSLMRSRVHS